MLHASLCAKIMVFRRITRIIGIVLNERTVVIGGCEPHAKKTQVRLNQNVEEFQFKRTCVSGKTYLCFSSNASTFSGAYLLGKFMPGLRSSSMAFFMLSFSVLITWKYSFMSQMSRASRAFSCVLISGSAVRNWGSL